MLQLKHQKTKPANNAGSFRAGVFLAAVDQIDVEGVPVRISQLLAGTDYTVEADESARDTTYSAPSGGERVYVESLGQYQEYDSNASAWVRISEAIINDTHTFTNASDGFIEVTATQDKSTGENELPTEDDVTGKILRTRFGRPGWTVDNLEFEKMLNEHGWIVVRVTKEGDMIQYGNSQDPCEVKVMEQPVGENATGYKGMIYEAKYEGNNIVHYKGALTLKS